MTVFHRSFFYERRLSSLYPLYTNFYCLFFFKGLSSFFAYYTYLQLCLSRDYFHFCFNTRLPNDNTLLNVTECNWNVEKLDCHRSFPTLTPLFNFVKAKFKREKLLDLIVLKDQMDLIVLKIINFKTFENLWHFVSTWIFKWDY